VSVRADRTAEVIKLLASYGTDMDHRNAASWLDLFATDKPQLEMVSIAYTATGREELAAFHARGGGGVHLTGLPVITDNDGQLVSVSPFIYVDATTNATMTGYYRDEFVEEHGGLRFAARRITIRGNSGS
jgi:hypothetical protein